MHTTNDSVEAMQLAARLSTESPEFARLWNDLQRHKKTADRREPEVVVCGLLKAGKSSLLNVITGHVADEYSKPRRDPHNGRYRVVLV